ncbi:hypothetical protein ABN067_14255, partial [Providencia rettgeri]
LELFRIGSAHHISNRGVVGCSQLRRSHTFVCSLRYLRFIFTRHISNSGGVGCSQLRRSHTFVCSLRYLRLPPSHCLNYLE